MGPSPAWLFLARLDGLIARLDQAQQAIATQGQNTRLQRRIGDDLARRLSEHRENLRARRNRIAAAGTVPDNAWAEVKSSASASLLDECLLYLQAARSRGTDVAADLCEITDALFEELARKAQSVSWKSFSVFAAEDSFDVLTQIIRVRYPISGVWDIPVAVHEFGHFLSGHLREVRADGSPSLPFHEYKNTFIPPEGTNQPTGQPGDPEEKGPAARLGPDYRAWLDEIFADVFAAYAAGPSFACSCLLFRFDPTSALDESDGKHPSYAKRAYSILQTLRRLNNEQTERGRLTAVINLLDESWAAACAAARIAAEVSEKDRNWLDGQVSSFYFMLKLSEGGLRFSDWEAASDKLDWLENPPESPGKFTLVQLLNAAWMLRLNPQSNPNRLSENFVKLARSKA